MRCLDIAFICILIVTGFANGQCYGNQSTCQTSTTEATNDCYCIPSTVLQPTTIRSTTTVSRTQTSWRTTWSTLTAVVTNNLTLVSTVVSTSISSIERLTTITAIVNQTVEVTRETTSTTTSIVISTLTSVDLRTITVEVTRASSIFIDRTATIIEPSLSTRTTILESTQTVTSEATRTENRVSTITETSVTTSIEAVEKSTTATELLPTTITQVVGDPRVITTDRTVFIVSTIVQISTTSLEVTRTLTSPTTITITTYITIISQPQPLPPSTSATQQFNGLVTCTTRDTNPTYTPLQPLPENYTWGCPPGQICQPRQQNCNFEQDFPSPSYICSPDECIDAPPLPASDNTLTDYSCGTLYDPIPGYFHLNPFPFGLGYWIFNVNGQQPRSCSSSPPSSWDDWQPHEGAFAERLQGRQAGSLVPSLCYRACDTCGLTAQSIGRVASLCSDGGEFQGTLANCNRCIQNLKGGALPDNVPPLLPQLHPYVNYCSELEAEASTAATVSGVGESTLPGVQGQTSDIGSGVVVGNATGTVDAGIFAGLSEGISEQRTTVSLAVVATSIASTAPSDAAAVATRGFGDQTQQEGTVSANVEAVRKSGEKDGPPTVSQSTETRPAEQAAISNGAQLGSYTGAGQPEQHVTRMFWLLGCLGLCLSVL